MLLSARHLTLNGEHVSSVRPVLFLGQGERSGKSSSWGVASHLMSGAEPAASHVRLGEIQLCAFQRKVDGHGGKLLRGRHVFASRPPTSQLKFACVPRVCKFPSAFCRACCGFSVFRRPKGTGPRPQAPRGHLEGVARHRFLRPTIGEQRRLLTERRIKPASHTHCLQPRVSKHPVSVIR